MDRDLSRFMMARVTLAVVLAAALSCQQSDRRESRGEVAASLPMALVPVPSPDADVGRAQTELAEGRAALATRIIMPVLRKPERRTPEAVLVAARAASQWGGWSLVSAMLGYEPWLSSRFAGEGLELLARSALERDDAIEARSRAEAALRVPSEPAARAIRLVLLARALDRLDVRDSAAATYRRAAETLPVVREWLLLRAAGATADTRARERLYATIQGAAARARIPYTEAQALERFHLEVGAATAYEKLGDMPSAYRLRLASDYNEAQRSGLRAGLLGYIQRDARGDNLQRALEVLDAAFPRLDATSQQLVTRRAAESGLHARAVAGFAKVPKAMLTDADVIAWARSLIATGKPTGAATRISARKFGRAAAAEAQYVRALALVRSGKSSAARTALQRVATAHGSTRYGGDAYYLLADLESDAGRDTRAREFHQRACRHRPAGGFADEACFRAGILSYALGDPVRAAAAFDELPKRFPNSPEAVAASYWSGRAWESAGSPALAREQWTAIVQRDPLSYYASVSARRLGSPQWIAPPAQIPRSPRFQSALTRSAVLDELGMDTEEKYEYEAIENEATETPATALSAGAALLDRGEVPRAIRLGWKAVAAGRARRDSTGNADQRGYALVYPLLRAVTLVASARAANLDPALVAAVIRQESAWNPRAQSRAGARGLMQVMPSVGEAIARSRGYPVWDPELLYDPEVSLELGTSHLRDALSSSDNLPRALAAYNAGASRVHKWIRRKGASDPELFIERIPFVETRDYVRIVLRNVDVYRTIHGLKK